MPEVPPTAGLPLAWRDLVAPLAQSLERGLGEFLGVSWLRIECSGTAALVVALSALKRRSARRRVIVPAYTCPLVAFAVLHCELIPVPCDLLPGSFQFDPDRLAALCKADTLAVIPTHLGGRVADLSPVQDAARSCGAAVIEDAAQSLGALYEGKPVGLAGDAGFYSLAVGKGLTIYEGGVLVAREESLRETFERTSAGVAFRNPLLELRRSIELVAYAALYRPRALQFAYGTALRRRLRNGRLLAAAGDEFSGAIPLHHVGLWRKAVGASALKRLPAFLATLESHAQPRLARLAAIRDISVIADCPRGRGTWPLFMVLLPSERARDAALALLWGAGLGVSRLYIHALPGYGNLAGKLEQTDTARARDLAARMLTVSNSPWMEEAEFSRVIRVLADAARSA